MRHLFEIRFSPTPVCFSPIFAFESLVRLSLHCLLFLFVLFALFCLVYPFWINLHWSRINWSLVLIASYVMTGNITFARDPIFRIFQSWRNKINIFIRFGEASCFSVSFCIFTILFMAKVKACLVMCEENLNRKRKWKKK